MNQYGLFKDKSKCISNNDKTYYLNQSDNLYYICNEEINNCEKCSSENICINCFNNYIRINNDKSNCHQIS